MSTATGARTELTGALLAPRLALATTSTVDDSGGAAPSRTVRTVFADAAAGISPVLGIATTSSMGLDVMVDEAAFGRYIRIAGDSRHDRDLGRAFDAAVGRG